MRVARRHLRAGDEPRQRGVEDLGRVGGATAAGDLYTADWRGGVAHTNHLLGAVMSSTARKLTLPPPAVNGPALSSDSTFESHVTAGGMVVLTTHQPMAVATVGMFRIELEYEMDTLP